MEGMLRGEWGEQRWMQCIEPFYNLQKATLFLPTRSFEPTPLFGPPTCDALICNQGTQSEWTRYRHIVHPFVMLIHAVDTRSKPHIISSAVQIFLDT
jgi:hypothetical protein